MKNKNRFNQSLAFIVLAALTALTSTRAYAAAFNAGDLAVVVAAASAINTTCSVVEINTTTAAQAAIQTIAIPGTGASAIRVSGSATSTLYVSDSNDGSLLCFTGVNLDGNTSGNVNTLNPRAVVTLDATGAMSIPTTYTGGNGNQTRGATTLNNSFWHIGDQGGYYTNGASAVVAGGNLRSVKAFGGTVYYFVASASLPPVSTVLANGTTNALLGLPNGATSMQDFYLISSGNNGTAFDVLYILQATSAAVGTIYKYSLVSGTWTANGTYATTFGGFGLCAAKSGGGAVLFVTSGTGATTANNVIKLTDTAGYNATITITTANNVTLYTTAAGTILKGLAFAPVSTVAIDNTGTPAAGSIAIGNTAVPVFGFRLTPSGSTDFTGLKLTTAGTATTADLSNLRVVYDADNSGSFNAGDSVVSSSAQSLANPVNFTITGQTGFSAARRYLVVADVAGGATVGHTFTGSIAAASDVTTSIAANGTAVGNSQTIAAAVFDITMSAVAASESATISSLVNNATISTTGQGAQVWQVTLNNAAGNAGAVTVTALDFSQGANNDLANWANVIQAAELFDGSTPLAAGTISATAIAFSGLNAVVADGAAKTFTLRLSLKNTPGALTDNAHFQFALAAAGVTLTGNNGVTTASVNSDAAQNQITVVATKLAFTQLPAYVITNTAFTVQVSAEDANGNLDLDNASSVVITVATGGGTLIGGNAQLLTGGNKKWTALFYDTVGLFSLLATDDGTAGTSLTAGTSASIVARVAPTLTDVVVPQYIQGGNANKRLPYAFRVALSNLLANATYRYYNSMVLGSDTATSTGAGNCIFAAASGNFVRTSSTSLSSVGGYGTFTTDANGSYTGWFISEPTGNARFATAGNQVFGRIILNDGNNGTFVQSYLTVTESATVLAFGTTADATTGTGIYGNSSATGKNLVVLYDNVAGTGRPLAATVVESDGVAETTANSYVTFYNDSVDGVSGAWGNIIPNLNANGVKRIEQRALADGSLVVANTDSDGAWPSGANTVSPTGGDATPIVITATDAPLTSAPPTTPVITAIQVSGGNVLIDFTGGTADVVGNFTVLSTADLSTSLTPIAATITTSGPGVFRATVVAGTSAAFYRIKH